MSQRPNHPSGHQSDHPSNQHRTPAARPIPEPKTGLAVNARAESIDDADGNMVCVTLQRPPHFWRFACSPDETGDLLERLAELADDANTPLTWSDAEMIASEIVIHHHVDTPSAG